ncbi:MULTISPECIES: hypothetical protein [unclassified Fibrobacter]|uniref:hypothetical protein n=1 Tax=unclassified Fibrobacter TaxID=2634177 RepID=UPI0009120E90|nr:MULTISPECIES: hypothetical protein [unclassified Fibrobacter]OWV04389.1 hypothetical protein B7993_11235 [Fibrobacter sp. UWH3]SHL73149.1 hypothetical protein SAMN05720765_12316 [Fibrobacter sp. UWH6]
MSMKEYNDFLACPMRLKERFPSLEETLLALDDFLPCSKKISGYETDHEDSFEKVKMRISNCNLGRQNIQVRDIQIYLNTFELNYKKFRDDFISVVKHEFDPLYEKNAHLVGLMHLFFRDTFNLCEDNHSDIWIKDRPKEKKPFTKCINEIERLSSPLQLSQQNNSDVLENYYQWKQGVTPQIDTLLSFLDRVEQSSIQKVSFFREKLLSLWFWQKSFEKYPFENTSKEIRQKIDKDCIEAEKTFELVKGPKMPYSLKDNDERINKLKDCCHSYVYPYLILMDFKHLLLQHKDKEALVLLEKMVPLYFYNGSPEVEELNSSWEWYSLFLSFIADLCSRNNVDKNKKKSLKALFKRIYSMGCFLKIELNEFNLEEKDKETIIMNRYQKRFKEWPLFQFSYIKLPKYKATIPSPDYKKVNQKKISFGNTSNCPQLIFFTQLNEPEIVENLLEKGAYVANTSPVNDSALFWNLTYLNLSQHLSYGRTYVCPPKSPLLYENKELTEYIYADKEAPYHTFLESYKACKNIDDCINDSYKVFKERKDSQWKNAYRIFKALIPHYKQDKGNSPSRTFRELTSSYESILNQAACSGNLEVLCKVIDLYKIYCGNDQKKWINKLAEKVQPRPPIYWIIRQYHYIYDLDLYLKDFKERPDSSFFRKLGHNADELLAKHRNITEPNNSATFAEQRMDAFVKLNSPIDCWAQNLLEVWERKYIKETLSEQKMLSMLKLLLENHANPQVAMDGTTVQRQKEYNPIYEAIEVGWLDGVRLMIESAQKQESDYGAPDVEKLKIYAQEWEKKFRSNDYPNHEYRSNRCREVKEYLASLQ